MKCEEEKRGEEEEMQRHSEIAQTLRVTSYDNMDTNKYVDIVLESIPFLSFSFRMYHDLLHFLRVQ